MSLALLFHYLLLNMFRMLLHPSSGACDLFVELFHGLYCSGLMCVGVTLWFGWGGVVSGCRLQPTSEYHTCKIRVHLNLVLLTPVAYRGGVGGFNPPPPVVSKALQNRTKLNPIVKNVKNDK